MACLVTNGNTNLSTANGFYTVEVFNNGSGASSTTLAISTERTIDLQFASVSANCLGTVLVLRFAGSGSPSDYYNTTVELQENTSYPSGTAWVTRASEEMTAAEMCNNVANVVAFGWIVPFTFSTPYAIDNSAPSSGRHRWRLRIIRSGTGTFSPVLITSNGTVPVYWTWTDVPATFADNDIVIAKDTLTIDKSATMKGTLGTGETAYAPALVICKSNDPAVANVGNVVWENPPASSHALTIDGTVVFGAHSGLRVGGENSRIPIVRKATISFPSSSFGSACGFKYVGTSFNTGRKASFFFYGERPVNNNRTTLDTSVSAKRVYFTIASPCVVTWDSNGFANGQSVYFTSSGTLPTGINSGQIYYAGNISGNTFNLYDTEENAIASGSTGRVNTSGSQAGTHTGNTAIVTVDTTGWSVGDRICIGGTINPSVDIHTTRTIASIDGTLVSVTPAFSIVSGGRLAGRQVIRCNGYGIEIIGNSTKIPVMHFISPSNMVVDGVAITDMNGILHGSGGDPVVNMANDDLANISKHIITHGSISGVNSTTADLFSRSIESPVYGIEVSHMNGGACATIGSQLRGIVSFASSQKSGACLLSNNWFLGGYNSIIQFLGSGMPSFGCVLQDNIFESASPFGGTSSTLELFGSNFVLNRNKFNSCTASALRLTTIIGLSGNDNHFNNNSIGILFSVGVQANCQLTDSVFGSEVPNIFDYLVEEGTFVGYQENSPSGAVTVNVDNLPGCPEGSLFKVRNYNDTAGDIRSWQPEGMFVSSAGKLLGKTVSSGVALKSVWKNTSDTISGQGCAVLAGCQIANAAYYAGTHVLPKLLVVYDGDQEAVDMAIESTSPQALLASFVPSDDNASIAVALSQQTDAAHADSGVTWNDLVFRQRRYGKVENSYTKNIVEITSDIVFNWIALSDNLFIAELSEVVVEAYTGIAIDHSARTLTVSSNHTWAEIYDYTQYDLSQRMDVDELLSTIDGITYSSDYDIIIDGAVVDASGLKINCGSNELQRLNDGLIVADRVTDVNGTLVAITLQNVAVGSRCYVEVQDTGEELMNQDATGSTASINYNHTTNINIFVRVRKGTSGLRYLPYDASGTITENGFSLVVSQKEDTIAN